MLIYSKFRYIYPPRAENALPASSIKDYDDGTFLAQPKLNGDCLLIFTNGIETIVMDRHKKQFSKPIKMMESLKMLHRESISEKKDDKSNKWMILVGEHMVKSQRNEAGDIWNEKYVIFDIIAFDGIQLIGKTFQERVELLDKLYGKEEIALTKTGTYTDKFLYATNVEGVFRVKSFYDCFTTIWNDLIKIEMYEGLVLKRMGARLENGNSQKNNTSSQIKFRRPTKNYSY